ncbi:MAG: FapA family protein [Methyloprofundus sp.]|nr:FapA family protein [Methyloprofundus sp.]
MNDQQQVDIIIEANEFGGVYASVPEGFAKAKYSVGYLEGLLKNEGCLGIEVEQEAHEEINALIKSKKAGRVKLGNKEDAAADVLIPYDKLTAKLSICTAQGGLEAGVKEIMAALDARKVDLSLVNKKRIVGLILQGKQSAPGSLIEVEVAKGYPPQHGQDTQFKPFHDGVTERQPDKSRDGSLEYRDLDELLSVEEGIELMRMIPPTEPKAGINVIGEKIEARTGEILEFNACDGAVVSPKNPNLLISSMKGQPIMANKGIKVGHLKTLGTVDLATGNIDYDGSVIIKENITAGMKVKATGDVQVFGMLEDGSIEAGGNVDIKLGALGHANRNSEIEIKCAGNLSAGYLDNIRVQTKGDVLIKTKLSNSFVFAEQQVVVGSSGQKKSSIAGGRVVSGVLIRAEELGGSSGVSTEVVVLYSDAVEERLKSIKKEIADKNAQLISMLGKMVGLSKKGTEKAKQEKLVLTAESEEMKQQITDLMEEQSKSEGCVDQVKAGRIMVQKETNPGVIIKIFDQELKVKSRYGAGFFALDEGKISFQKPNKEEES